jgi:hypothetical protein
LSHCAELRYQFKQRKISLVSFASLRHSSARCLYSFDVGIVFVREPHNIGRQAIHSRRAVPSSGAPVSKLRGDREMGGFFAGMHASKSLNTVRRNLLRRYRPLQAIFPTA